MAKTPHHPEKLLNLGLSLDYNKFAKELADAQYSLGLLQGLQKKLQNSSLLISPLTAKEAAVSSSIEGTQSTVSDVFLYEAGGQPRHSDAMQVANYRMAMNFAIDELKKGRQISLHLIKTLHQILLKNVRHKGKLGDFRMKPVWIAEKMGDPIEKAIYIPPEYHFVIDYIENLLSYIENGKENTLIKAGIAHYQFEAVHPFEDGNGRIGRLLIPLVIYYKRKLDLPILYLSGYFDAHRDEYLNALHQVDETGNYEIWLAFFFKSVAEQLKETQKLVENIYSLHDNILEKFGTGKSPYLLPFVEALFKVPIFTIPQIKNSVKASSNITLKRLIKFFQEKNLIVELSIRRNRFKIFKFKPLLDLL